MEEEGKMRKRGEKRNGEETKEGKEDKALSEHSEGKRIPRDQGGVDGGQRVSLGCLAL